jgi:hypothetical protein
MIALHRRLARGCQSLNQLNAVHLALEFRMTPLDVMAIWSGLMQEARPTWPKRAWRRLLRHCARLPLLGKAALVSRLQAERRLRAHANGWISKQRQMLEFVGDVPPSPFVRRRLRCAVSLYADGASPRGKTLLICFSGNAYRLMMPTPLFLQHIDPRLVDVAYLRTDRHHGYRNGIRGVGESLESAIDGLVHLLDLRAYGRVAAVGTSGGGLPAILAGLRLGADAVLAAGPNSPEDRRWATLSNREGAASLFRRFASHRRRAPAIHLVHGADNRRDEESAKLIASCVSVQSITAVPGADHGCLYELVQRRQFGPLLKSTVLAQESRLTCGS